MRVIFVDVEASSLTHDSVPIEVGWAVVDGDVEGHLIRPAHGWNDWSFESEAVHGIPRSLLLTKGEPHDGVAARVLEVLGAEDAVVLSDASEFDQAWLTELLHAAGLKQRIRIHDAADAYADEIRRLRALLPDPWRVGFRAAEEAFRRDAAAIHAEAHELERQRKRVRHRAGSDAEGMRWVFEEIRRRVDERLQKGGGLGQAWGYENRARH